MPLSQSDYNAAVDYFGRVLRDKEPNRDHEQYIKKTWPMTDDEFDQVVAQASGMCYTDSQLARTPPSEDEEIFIKEEPPSDSDADVCITGVTISRPCKRRRLDGAAAH